MTCRRPAALVISAATLAAALVTSAACHQGDREISCNVDVDCPQSFVCRANICVSLLAPDASIDAGGGMRCLDPGDTCNTDDQCCTPPCRNFRCVTGTGTSGKTSSGTSGTSGTSGASGTSGTSGASSSGMGCTDVFGICAVDSECCTGLSCTMGSCR